MRVEHKMIATAVLACTTLLISGCTTNKVDWESRIGTYTFDQAVTELGPPDKQATLANGTRVADWMTRRGGVRTVSITPYYGYGPNCYGPVYPSYVNHYIPDYFLRLMFDPEGNLTKWRKFAR